MSRSMTKLRRVASRNWMPLGCLLGAMLTLFAGTGRAQTGNTSAAGPVAGGVDVARTEAARTQAAGQPCRGAPGSMPAVRWIEPEGEADRHALRERCRTVGPPGFFVPNAARDVRGLDSLVVVTWNIHVGGGDLSRFVTRLRTGDWSGGVPVEHFVLLLQEVHRAGDEVPDWEPGFETPDHIDTAPASGLHAAGIVASGRQLGLHTFYAPSMRNGGESDPREDRGNAILSTLPLAKHTIIALPFEGQRRVVVAATVRGRSSRGHEWALGLCSAHLDAQSSGLRIFSSLAGGRLRQARFLVRSLTQGHIILGGDFNTWTTGPREPAISVIRDAFPQPERLGDGATFSRRMLYDPRVDYLFFRLAPRDQVRYRRVEQRFDSDHNPLIATVPVLNLSQ